MHPTLKLISGRPFEYQMALVPVFRRNGLRPLGLPGFNAVHPGLVIHDILEHVYRLKKDGSLTTDYTPESEFQAVGTMLHTRYEFEYFDGHDINGTVAPSWVALYYSAFEQKTFQITQCPIKTAHRPLKNWTTEVAIHTLLSSGFEYCLNYSQFFSKQKIALIKKSMSSAAPWIRLGYLRSLKRFEGIPKVRLSLMHREVTATLSDRIRRGCSNDVITVRCWPQLAKTRVDVVCKGPYYGCTHQPGWKHTVIGSY